MKMVFFIFVLCFSECLAQSTDSVCIKARWISIKPTPHNANLFGLDTNEQNDIVSVIKTFALTRNIDLYYDCPNEYLNRFLIRFNYLDSLRSYRKTQPDSWFSDPFFEAEIHSNNCLKNKFGEDSLQALPTGEIIAIYPDPIVFEYKTRDCIEIRIKEELRFVSNLKKKEFYPVEIAFCINGKVKFWMKLPKLFEVIDLKRNYKWYDFIINKRYKGFQYMQEECN